MDTPSYSIWLMPEDEIYDIFQSLIKQLSKPYTAPDFEPHITLIGQLEEPESDLISKTSQLASRIKPYHIKLTEVDYLDEYFRCLFVRVEQTSEVMSAYKQAQKIFKKVHTSGYVPHLSLMYGNVESRIKKTIISAIGKNFNIGFENRNLYLYSTFGHPETWHRIEIFSLE